MCKEAVMARRTSTKPVSQHGDNGETPNIVARDHARPDVLEPDSLCEYIERVGTELSKLAHGRGAEFLAYLLSMAAAEAQLAKTRFRVGEPAA
jgi:hypothetical protein